MAELSGWQLLSYWPVLIFWPAIVAGLITSGLGVVRRRVPLVIGGAGLMLPASLYLVATPRLHLFGLLPVACVAGAAFALSRRRIGFGRVALAGATGFWGVVAWMLLVA